MAPTIQVFGTKKCSDTAKALRFFKERAVAIQFVDLNIKGLSKGELDSVCKKIQIEDLLDRDGKQYKNRGMEYKVFELEEELLADPLLLKTPITRFGREAALGVQPEIWKKWIGK